MAKLVTGGTGNIASETVRQLVNRGEEVVVFDIYINRSRIEDIENKVKVVKGDVGNFSHVLNVVKENKIDTIYHMGSMLTAESENNPWSSIQSNVMGTYHILEAARLFDVEKILLTSSRATFGLGIDEVVDDWTIQRPIVFYGWGKLYCEGIGRWYKRKFGIDFRSVRYPAMIAPTVNTPGHWGPPMIADAILGKHHLCEYGTPTACVPWIYKSDAVKAAIAIMDAPSEKIVTLNYNVASMPEAVSARELENFLRKRYPGFQVEYKTEVDSRQRTTTKVFNDSYARKEWGWQPEFGSLEAIVEQFEKEMKSIRE